MSEPKCAEHGARLAVLEALHEQLKEHTEENKQALLIITKKLHDIDRKLNNGISETMASVARTQETLSKDVIKHGVYWKTTFWLIGTAGGVGVIGALLKRILGG